MRSWFDHRILDEFRRLYPDVTADVLSLKLEILGYPDLIIWSLRAPFYVWLIEVKSITDKRRKAQANFCSHVSTLPTFKKGILRVGTVVAHDAKLPNNEIRSYIAKLGG